MLKTNVNQKRLLVLTNKSTVLLLFLNAFLNYVVLLS